MILTLFFFQMHLHAKVIHQYYQKISSNNTHIGYAIVREEHFPKKKQVVVTTFVKTNSNGGDITEGLKAYASDSKLAPISYQYTAIIGKNTKTIDAVVRDNTLFATITEGKSKKTLQKKLTPHSFFSSFLLPRILRKGLAKGKNYKFDAVAEEDAALLTGRLQVVEEAKYKGQDVYRVLNDYKQNRFYSFVTPTGKILKTENPITKIHTETVDSKDLAVGDISFPEAILKTLFDKIP